jgi:hypothetical protein
VRGTIKVVGCVRARGGGLLCAVMIGIQSVLQLPLNKPLSQEAKALLGRFR